MIDRTAVPVPKGLALIRNICVGRDHFAIGRDKPDGSGHLTIINREWAYCAAGRGTEKHFWLRIPARPLAKIRHATDWLAPS